MCLNFRVCFHFAQSQLPARRCGCGNALPLCFVFPSKCLGQAVSCPLKSSWSLQVFQLLDLAAGQSRCCPLASSLQQGFWLQDCSPAVWRWLEIETPCCAFLKGTLQPFLPHLTPKHWYFYKVWVKTPHFPVSYSSLAMQTM